MCVLPLCSTRRSPRSDRGPRSSISSSGRTTHPRLPSPARSPGRRRPLPETAGARPPPGARAPGRPGGGAAGAVGTIIIAQLSGSVGGTGTYTVSIPQTVLSGAITTAVPTLNTVVVNANQDPEISSTNIAVLLL